MRQTLLMLAILLVSTTATAQTLRNVSGTEGMQLSDKTCIGVFLVPGGTSENSMGANVMKFSVRDGLLIGHLWSKFGRAIYEKTVADMGKRNWLADTTGFDDVGEVRDLSVRGPALNYVNSRGYKTNLSIAGGRHTGTVDPRPMQPNVAQITRDCR